jgi:hypothetical protein
MAAFLSGEMKDTVQMNPAGAYGNLISPLFHYFPSFLTLFPNSSIGALLFTKGTKRAIFELGWECEHVDEGTEFHICPLFKVPQPKVNSAR